MRINSWGVPGAAILLLCCIADCSADGEWTRHVIDAGSRGADGVRLADVNGDGRIDVVTPWEEGGEVRVAYDRGVAASPRWQVEIVGKERSVEDAVATDLDGDGILEVVAAAEGKARAIRVFTRQHMEGPWTGIDLGDSRNREQFMFALPMDFPATGRVLITGSKNGKATISQWQPAGGGRRDFANWASHTIRPAGWIMSLQAVDLNADGINDLLVSDRKGVHRGVWWFRGTKTGVAREPVLIGGQDVEVMFLTTADFDGDGDLDIAVAARPQLLLLFENRASDGTDWEARTLALPADAGLGKGVAVETEFGQTEIFVSSGPVPEKNRRSIVRFDWNDPTDVMTGDPDLIDTPGGTAGIKFDRMELVDMDGDGDRDLLTCEERENLGVIWYERPNDAN